MKRGKTIISQKLFFIKRFQQNVFVKTERFFLFHVFASEVSVISFTKFGFDIYF